MFAAELRKGVVMSIILLCCGCNSVNTGEQVLQNHATSKEFHLEEEKQKLSRATVLVIAPCREPVSKLTDAPILEDEGRRTFEGLDNSGFDQY